jgi:hypothetical protein
MTETEREQEQHIEEMQIPLAETNPFHQLELGPDGSMSEEQALAFQQFHAMHGGFAGLPQGSNFPRPTVKRRKPVKWEHWEEKNLIEGVRRFGRGNWSQIRAAMEFQSCRTNVDLHDKWRVLTGERKRNRQRAAQAALLAQDDSNGANDSHLSADNTENVGGTYNLSSFLPTGYPNSMNMEGHLQIPHELLLNIQNNLQENVDITQENIMEEALKAQKQDDADQDVVASELLKLCEEKLVENNDEKNKKKRHRSKKKPEETVLL